MVRRFPPCIESSVPTPVTALLVCSYCLAVVRAVSVAAAGGLPAEGLDFVVMPAVMPVSRSVVSLVIRFGIVAWWRGFLCSIGSCFQFLFHNPHPRRGAVGADAPLAGARKDAPPGQLVRVGGKVRVRSSLSGNRPNRACVRANTAICLICPIAVITIWYVAKM